MYLQEILQLDAEISDNLRAVESRLLRLFPPRKIAENCLVVSANMAELVQLSIQKEFDDKPSFSSVGSIDRHACRSYSILSTHTSFPLGAKLRGLGHRLRPMRYEPTIRGT